MGPLGTIALNAPLALGAYWLPRGALCLPRGYARGFGAIALAWLWSALGLEFLGSLGFLELGPLAGWSLLLLATGAFARFRHREPRAEQLAREVGPWSWCEVVALGLVLAPAIMLGVQSLVGPVKVVSDGPIYHLYFAARWWQAGRLELVPVPFGENAATYFPANGDLWFTWLLVGWGGDRLAKVGQAPFLLLAGITAFDLARRLGAGRSAALVASAWFATCFPLILFSFEPNVDTIFVAGYLLAAWFFVAYALGEVSLPGLGLGAVAAGLAWGTKPTGTVFVPPLLLVGGLLALMRPGRPAARLGRLVLVGVLALVPVAFWFGRNAWLAGNPLYPLDVSAPGWVGWYDADVMRQGPYYLPRSRWPALADILLAVLDPRMAPFWLAAILGAWFRPGGDRRRDRLVWACSALAIANVALYWALVPYRTQQRFFLQALGLAVVPLARLFDRSRLLRTLAVVVLGLHVLSPQLWPLDPRREPPWDQDTAIPNAIGSLLSGAPVFLSRSGPVVMLLLGVLMLCALGTALAWLVAVRRPGGRAAALAVTATLGLMGLAQLLQTPVDRPGRVERFFPPFPDFYRGWLTLDAASGPRGTIVAYAGTNIPYYLMGRDLRNRVRYVNVDGHRDWLLHDYHREAIGRGRPHWTDFPRPGWDRAAPDYDAWLANLRAAGVRLLVITRVNPLEGPHNVADVEGFPIERKWAEGHPERFQPVYGVLEADPWFRLYRVVGPEKNPENWTEGGSGAH